MQDQPAAAFLIIGNEILSGRTQDTNLHYLANALTARGINLLEVRVVPDIEACIVKAIHALRQQYAYVFTSGGIGPTHDDITSNSIARAFGVKAVKHKEAWKMLEEHYRVSEYAFNAARQKMAMIPEGARLIPNPLSAAPGFIVENVYVMAGVPAIFQVMVDHVAAGLEGGAVLISRTICTDLPEGTIATELGGIQARHPDVQIGSYPSFERSERSVSIVLRHSDAILLAKAADAIIHMIRTAGGKVQER